MDYITPAQFEDEMLGLANRYYDSPEVFHIGADELICKVLKSLGYEAGIKIFTETRKWYS